MSAFLALVLTGNATFAADECTKLLATGHPEYPVIAYRDGDKIVGAAATLVETIAKKLNVPIESKYTGTWADAQEAARDGKVDIIFGLYHNEERAKYLDYVQPAFTFDDVAIFVAKGKEFSLTGKDDLIGKKGLTNKGESYGDEFDAFIKDKLDVTRTDGIDAALKDLADGKADYVIAGYYPGNAEVVKLGLEDKIVGAAETLVET
ncbi:MAG: transporter substrate-binding domain-containing protein, partial [Methyloceanibacter sp.]|nr:transporter substrate-binding domain-containing protein [Methyloceanibacter sp.]